LEGGKRKERANLLLNKIQRAREGKSRFTLAKGPFGNSTIIFEKAKKRMISVREPKELKSSEQRIAARKMQ
jgi:C4-type Zn-finger protein